MSKNDIWSIIGLVAWFWPWLFLAIDGLGLFFIGVPFTAIPWSEAKVLFAIAYPILVGMFVAGLS